MPENESAAFLAVDLGASSGRAVVGRFVEGRLEIEEAHRFANGPLEAGGALYWDAARLRSEVLAGIRRGAALAGGKLSGVGVDTWGVDFGLLDDRGELLGNPVHYRDARTDGMMERVFEVVPRAKIFETTGIQFLQFNTIFQLAAMAMQGRPELRRARTLVMMPDLFHYYLCGKKSTEFTNATTTQLYDPRAGDWAWDLIEALGLPAEIMPEVLPPGTVLGLLAGVAAGEVPVIAPACHDTGSAVAAVPADPAMQPGSWAYLSSGTWSLMGIEATRPLINAKALEHNFTNEGGVAGFRFLKNIAGMWLFEECRRTWAKEGGTTDYEKLYGEARESEPFRSLIDVDHGAFLRPDNMPRAIAEVCRSTGRPAPETRGQFVRCILESLALRYCRVRDLIEDVSGVKIETLHVVGGGSQNQMLNQFTADALGVPVVAGPVEATAIGNLIVQAMAAGVLEDLVSAREVVGKSFPLKIYQPGQTDRWREHDKI